MGLHASSNELVIIQTSNQAIRDWHSFDIASKSQVVFEESQKCNQCGPWLRLANKGILVQTEVGKPEFADSSESATRYFLTAVYRFSGGLELPAPFVKGRKTTQLPAPPGPFLWSMVE